MGERQRLGVQDALWLEMDKPGNLMVVDSLFWTATPDQVMSFTIYSYDGKVFVGIAADAALVPDHGQIVDGFADAFRRLSVRVG
jgi:uncharacterized protein DUF1298